MGKMIKSNDVFDPNAMTETELRGQVVGRYRPTGPNKWDDFELLAEGDDGDLVELKAGERIQVEPLGAAPEVRFRAREGREVLVLRWLPTDEDRAALATGKWGVQESKQASALERAFGLAPKDDPRDDMLEYFLDVKSDPYESEAGVGAAALLVQKLKKGGMA